MGFKIDKAFQTNKQFEVEGKKMTLVPAKGDQKEAYLMIARKGNPKYKAFVTKALQENQQMLRTGTDEAEALAQSIFRDAASRFVLVGWGGIDWKDAVDVPYSVETAREMLDLDDFYKTVDTYSDDMSNYRDEEVKAEAGN